MQENPVVEVLPVEQAVDILMGHMYVKYNRESRDFVRTVLTSSHLAKRADFNGFVEMKDVQRWQTYYNDRSKEIWQL
ncbi:hypothetical protein D3C75_1180970 [compost metagenome]